MDGAYVIKLLIVCGVAAMVGGWPASRGERFKGAHFLAAFAVFASIGVLSSTIAVDWLQIFAPVALAYAAAAAAISVGRRR